MKPLVSVICLCFNHEAFVEEAILSVINQSYDQIEIIVIDDASSDGSVEKIDRLKQEHQNLRILVHTTNVGNCRSFNEGLSQAKGKYIIDFATDDVMLPERIERQVAFFEKCEDPIGVIYSNSDYINESGNRINTHFSTKNKKPEGDVFIDLLERYHIEPSSMMVKKDVHLALGGYDANLSFEDFDFWIRSARLYQYAYQDEVLTKRRRHEGSLSTKFSNSGNNPLTISILKTCDKAIKMIKTEAEKKALVNRVRYELRFAYRTKQMIAVGSFYAMLKQLKKADWFSFWVYKMSSY